MKKYILGRPRPAILSFAVILLPPRFLSPRGIAFPEEPAKLSFPPWCPSGSQDRGCRTFMPEQYQYRRGHRAPPLAQPPNPLPHDPCLAVPGRAPGHDVEPGLAHAGVVRPIHAQSVFFKLSLRYGPNVPWLEGNWYFHPANPSFVLRWYWRQRLLSGGNLYRRSSRQSAAG